MKHIRIDNCPPKSSDCRQMSTPRIRPVSDLPPLERILPHYTGLKEAPSRSSALLLQLRQLALRLRRAHPRRFYSTREVARFFGVDPELARRAFAELQREGILTRLRGSMTLLQPRTKGTRTPVRGVVGLPVWLYGHSMIADWQFLYRRLEERLRHHGFVGDFIFYEMGEPDNPAFIDRLLEHDLDVLLWYLPLPGYRMLLQTVADEGIQPVVISAPGPSWPCPAYVLRWDDALRKCLASWRAEGVTTVALFSYPEESQAIRGPLRESGLTLLDNRPFDRITPALAERLAGEPRTATLLTSDLWIANAYIQDRPQFLHLLRDTRCLLWSCPACNTGELSGVAADLALIDWDKAAERIASDLATGMLPPASAPTAIHAVYRRHVRGNDLCRQASLRTH